MIFQKTNWVIAALLSLFLATLSACDNGGGKHSRQVVSPDLSEYSKASCEYGFDEGPGAQSYSSNVQTSYFGKKIDTGHLRSVLRASAAEVIRFAESLGVTFYKASLYDAKNCELMVSLPSAPQDLEAQFLRAEGVLGMYLPAQTTGVPTTYSSAAIAVRRDANKWVLVHEFSHHLFQMQIENTYGRTYDVKKELLGAINSYDRAAALLKQTTNADKSAILSDTVHKLIYVNTLALRLVKQYMLEEMTIESILGEKLDSGELTLVIPQQRINGAAYILRSSKKAEEFMDMIGLETTAITSKFSSIMNPDELNELRSYWSYVANIKAEMSLLNSRALNFIRSRGLQYHGLQQVNWNQSGLVGDEVTEAHMGCSHEHEADQVIKEAEKVLLN